MDLLLKWLLTEKPPSYTWKGRTLNPLKLVEDTRTKGSRPNMSPRALRTILAIVLKSHLCTLTGPSVCFTLVWYCVCVCMNTFVHTHVCVISSREPSGIAAATGAPDWWQLIMKHQVWYVPLIASCRSLAFPQSPPVALCNPGKEVPICKQLFLR